MKKIIFTAFTLMVISLTSSGLFAQGMGMGGGCGMGMGMGMHKPFQHLEMLQYTFDLTNAQVDKIYKIDKDYMDKFHQNRNNPDKIRDLREKHDTEIESVLTAEQKVKWNDFRKNHPMRGKGKNYKDCPGFGQQDGAGPGRLDMIQKDLGLSNEQADKIYKIHRDYMDKFYQNRHDGDKVRELRAKQDTEIENILTAEQKTKWNEFKKNHPKKGQRPGMEKGNKGHNHHHDTDDKK